MTTTTVDPRVVDDTATVLAALADLDFAEDRACELCFRCEITEPDRAEWYAVSRTMGCQHVHSTDWLLCGRCLEHVLRHRQHLICTAAVRCSAPGCGAEVLLRDWLVSYRPIDQPAWSKSGDGRG